MELQHKYTHRDLLQLTCICESSLSIKPFVPTCFMQWAILQAMTLLLERNIKRAEEAAIKIDFQ